VLSIFRINASILFLKVLSNENRGGSNLVLIDKSHFQLFT
jgi:hypothetical protein